jgi:hypothetical protein
MDSALESGAICPEPLLQLNPTFFQGGTIDELVADGTLHPECARIFRIAKSRTDHYGNPLLLHAHQRGACALDGPRRIAYDAETLPQTWRSRDVLPACPAEDGILVRMGLWHQTPGKTGAMARISYAAQGVNPT